MTEMASLGARGSLSWRELAKRVWHEVNEDNVFGRAAELSYYFLLALIPFLIFLTSVIGLVLGSGTGTRHTLFQYLARIMPPSAFQLIDSTMWEVSAASSGGKLSFGILATLWAASNGLSAITDSLNAAYDLTESRPWWKRRLVAIGLTMALSVLIIGALILVVAGGRIAESLAAAYGFGPVFPLAWKIIQWPVVLGCMILAFALIYYFAPDFREQKWKWLTPGAAIGVALWLLISIAFRVYLHFFNSYSATYGSLGAVIILMLWLYFTGAAVLTGGEINSEIENAAAKQGEPEAKEKGEKAPEEKDEKKGHVQAA
ncbi:MAG TPA: YihY/virulence factor BrkB family protein [Pyrinomonadaceae bacterium]